jgi:hypothetical protein
VIVVKIQMEVVSVKIMQNNQKAQIYDSCLRESDQLQRENSKLKSEYAGNIPQHIQEQINRNSTRISVLVSTLEGLFN